MHTSPIKLPSSNQVFKKQNEMESSSDIITKTFGESSNMRSFANRSPTIKWKRESEIDVVIRLDDSAFPVPEPLLFAGQYSLGPDMIFGWKPEDLNEIENFQWRERNNIKLSPSQENNL